MKDETLKPLITIRLNLEKNNDEITMLNILKLTDEEIFLGLDQDTVTANLCMASINLFLKILKTILEQKVNQKKISPFLEIFKSHLVCFEMSSGVYELIVINNTLEE